MADVNVETAVEEEVDQADEQIGVAEEQKDSLLKQQIVMKVKEVVERVVFTEYISQLEPAVANGIMGRIHVRHRVNYNQKQGCLQSNILILEKDKPLLKAH